MTDYLSPAADAAREAGAMLRKHYGIEHDVNDLTDHDIKLEMDDRCQALITERLLGAFPGHAIYGEEGVAGDQDSPHQWIVDPIDGTVNYFYGIPHFCVSIALRRHGEVGHGVIYDPMMDELWSVGPDSPPALNDTPITVSARENLRDAVVTIGFSKTGEAIDAGLARYKAIAHRVRKTRMLGSAALALAYIACGRLDAYIEESISIWDVAAGIPLVRKAGGQISLNPSSHKPDQFAIVASNGRLPLDAVL